MMDIQHPKFLSNHINKENLGLQIRTVSPFKFLYPISYNIDSCYK